MQLEAHEKGATDALKQKKAAYTAALELYRKGQYDQCIKKLA